MQLVTGKRRGENVRVYRGVPITRPDGAVEYVQPVRAIEAPNGTYYLGVKSVDTRGMEFVYNQYPANGVVPVEVYRLLDNEGFALVDANGYALFVRR